MSIKSGLFLAGCIMAMLLVLYCSKNASSPYEITNSRFGLVFKSSSGVIADSAITDTVDRTDSIGVLIYLPSYFDSISISVKTADGSVESTVSIKDPKALDDTTWYPVPFSAIGKRAVTGTAYRTDKSQVTASGTIMIYGKTIAVGTRPSDQNVKENGTATFTISVTCDTPVTYQWFKGDASVGADTHVLVISPVIANSQGFYTCLVTDKWGDTVTIGPFLLMMTASTAENHKPTLSCSGAKNVSPGQTCTLFLIVADIDTRQTFNYSKLSGPGSLTDTTYQWTPSAADTGSHRVVFMAADDGTPKMYDTLTLDIIVSSTTTPVNAKPQWKRNPISIDVKENSPLTVPLVDSCTDPDGDNVTFILLKRTPARDTLLGPATYGYSPSFDDSGAYTVKIIGTDGMLSDTLLMNVHVINVNRRPAFAVDTPKTAYRINANSQLSFSIRATDPDKDSVDYAILYGESDLPRKADASITGRTVSWKSQLGDSGSFTIMIAAMDGKDTARQPVQVVIGKVNAAPSISIAGISRGQTMTVKEGDSLKFSAKATDLDSATGEKVFLKLVDKSPFSCATRFSFDSTTGSFVFAPSYLCVKKDSMLAPEVKFVATDDGVNGTLPQLSDTFSVKIQVLNTNRPPSITHISDKSVEERKLLNFSVVANDPDTAPVPTISAGWLQNGVMGTNLPEGAIFNGTSFSWTPTSGQANVYTIIFTASDGIEQANDSVIITVTKPTFSILLTSAGNGSVIPSGTQFVTAGTDLAILALPNSGYGFSEWSATVGLTFTNPMDSSTKVLNISAGGTVTAHFVPVHQIMITSDGKGSVNPTGILYVKEGGSLQVAAKGAGIYTFLKWSKISGNLTIEDSLSISTRITNITSPGTIRANFTVPGMKLIPAGTFIDDNGNTVIISKPFFMDSTEVTQKKYLEIYGINPSQNKLNQNLPVETVSWLNAILYCNKLSKTNGLDTVYSYSEIIQITYGYYTYDSAVNLVCNWGRKGYRLPTEDEWELAAHGGKQLTFPTGDTVMAATANISSATHETTPVASYSNAKHPFGLYDLAGNVDEWCWDATGTDANRTSGRTDYHGDPSSNIRVYRGGAYGNDPNYARCDVRQSDSDIRAIVFGRAYIGFRPVLQE